MRSAERLFEIIQVLRRSKRPLTALEIAEELEISRRTVYRDITALIARRVPIRGEAGVGYVLDGGFDLPPLMLTPSEIEAVVLGAQWVIANADPHLSASALDVLSKVSAIIPKQLRDLVDDPVVGTPAARGKQRDSDIDLRRMREWCRREQKLQLHYADERKAVSERTVWPILIGYVAGTRVLGAWCELRKDFRIFRTDRLLKVEYLAERYPEPRRTLRTQWLDWVHKKER